MKPINIKVKANDLIEVINSLKLDKKFKEEAVFSFDIEIEDCKDNYKYLNTSDKIIDWDFTTLNNEENKINELKENKEEIVKDDNYNPNPPINVIGLSNCNCNSNCEITTNTVEDIYLFLKEKSKYLIKSYTDIVLLLYTIWYNRDMNRDLTVDFFNKKIIPSMTYPEFKSYAKYSINFNEFELKISNNHLGDMIEDVSDEFIKRLIINWKYIMLEPSFEKAFDFIYK